MQPWEMLERKLLKTWASEWSIGGLYNLGEALLDRSTLLSFQEAEVRDQKIGFQAMSLCAYINKKLVVWGKAERLFRY